MWSRSHLLNLRHTNNPGLYYYFKTLMDIWSKIKVFLLEGLKRVPMLAKSSGTLAADIFWPDVKKKFHLFSSFFNSCKQSITYKIDYLLTQNSNFPYKQVPFYTIILFYGGLLMWLCYELLRYRLQLKKAAIKYKSRQKLKQKRTRKKTSRRSLWRFRIKDWQSFQEKWRIRVSVYRRKVPRLFRYRNRKNKKSKKIVTISKNLLQIVGTGYLEASSSATATEEWRKISSISQKKVKSVKKCILHEQKEKDDLEIREQKPVPQNLLTKKKVPKNKKRAHTNQLKGKLIMDGGKSCNHIPLVKRMTEEMYIAKFQNSKPINNQFTSSVYKTALSNIEKSEVHTEKNLLPPKGKKKSIRNDVRKDVVKHVGKDVAKDAAKDVEKHSAKDVGKHVGKYVAKDVAINVGKSVGKYVTKDVGKNETASKATSAPFAIHIYAQKKDGYYIEVPYNINDYKRACLSCALDQQASQWKKEKAMKLNNLKKKGL